MPRRMMRRAAVVGGAAAVAGRRGAKRGAAEAQQQMAAEPAPEAVAEPEAPSMESKTADLKQLKELLDSGILTQEEFDAQKADILAS